MNRRSCVALVLSLTIFVSACPGPGPLSAGTFGFALNGLLNKVGNLITAAQNAGSILEVGAGGQIAAAIESAKAAYEHELNVSLDRLTVEQKKVLDDLTTQVSYLENHATEQLKEIVDHGALIANTIPFSKTLPQVSHYKPFYVVPSLGGDTLLTIEGNFFDAARQGYAPQLTIGATTLPAVISTTLALTFKIPQNLIQNSGSGLNYIPARLDTPYDATCRWLFHCKNQSSFQFLLVAVPATAGRLTFITTQSVGGKESKNVTSGEFSQESNDNDIPDPIGVGFQHCWQPDAGWRVIPSSVNHVVTWSQGDEGNGRDWWWNNNTSNLANACWNLTTIHHGFGTSGKVHFVLTFTEERDVLQHQETSTVDELKWGSTKLYTIPNDATWRAVYEEFDGRRIDINSAQLDNPYLRVKTSGNTINFQTLP